MKLIKYLFAFIGIMILVPQSVWSNEQLSEKVVKDLIIEATLERSPAGTEVVNIKIHKIPDSPLVLNGKEHWWVPAEVTIKEPPKSGKIGASVVTVTTDATEKAVYGFYKDKGKWKIGRTMAMSMWESFERQLKKRQ